MARDNRDIWAAVNWRNTNVNIARRLNCTTGAVRYQRKLAGFPPARKRGGNKFTHPKKYKEGNITLPEHIQL